MKKFYLMLVMALMTVIANATTVSFTNPDGWSSVYCYCWNSSGTNNANWPGQSMTKSGDVWTIDLGDFNPDFVIFNGGNGGPQTGNLTFVDGATYDKSGPIGADIPEHTVYFENTDNWSAVYVYMWGGYVNGWPGEPMTLVEGDLYKFVFKCDDIAGQCLIFNNGGNGAQTSDIKNFVDGATYLPNGTIKGEGSIDPVAPVFYVRGLGGNWDASDATKMTDDGNGVYTYSIAAISAGETFKIACANWDDGQYSTLNTSMELDAEYEMMTAAGYNTDMAMGVSATDVTITFDYNNMKMTVTGTASGPIDPVYPVFYVRGIGANWDATDDNIMTNDGNGVYTYNIATLRLREGFKIACANWDDGQYSTCNLDMELDTEYDMVSASGYNTDMAMGIAVKDATITFDYNAMKLIVTGTPDEPIVVEPKELYVVGTMTGWSFDENYHMTREDNVYTYTFTDNLVITSSFDDEIKFKIWDGTWDWSFGAGGVGITPETKGQELDSWFNGADFTLYDLNPEGSESTTISGLTIKFTLVKDSDYLGTSIPSIFEFDYSLLTGVENIAADAADAVRYYNLQGVEVAEPAAGLYIRVRGAQTDKVYIR